jgi:hypothetical protein
MRWWHNPYVNFVGNALGLALAVVLAWACLDAARIQGVGKERLLKTLSNCCIELYLFQSRIEAGMAVKAQDVSHRLTTIPPTEPALSRYVK